jgi:hypothetical protein
MVQDFWFGAITLGLSLAGLMLENSWFEYSRIGKTLTNKFGDQRAKRISRAALLLFATLGSLLMLGYVQTLNWK